MKENIDKKKCKLVEKLGVLIENTDQIAPLAARILSYIILTGKVGTTFEELVSKLCASKSTISTHLNHLLDLQKIEYFTKTGDRKKYFIINKNVIFQSIDEMTKIWQDQKKLHIEIKDYKETSNKKITEDSLKFDTVFHDNYIQYLNEATEAILKLRQKITEKINTNF